MNRIIYSLVVLVVISSCKQKADLPKEWGLDNVIQLDGVNPIGITQVDGNLWLSDGDHNRVVRINAKGNITKIIDSLDRPMHIDALEKTIFIPEYGKDSVATYDSKGLLNMILKDSLDAPAGVSAYKNQRAIADFYNNRILYFNGDVWLSFGKEGKAEGEFYYPTDVQITESKIWVADAYNNRVQVFDKSGRFLSQLGKEQKMNAATGIFVAEQQVFVTDFENDRVLVFNKQGVLLQELKDQIEKPTDILLVGDTLYVINYRNGKLLFFGLKPKKSSLMKQMFTVEGMTCNGCVASVTDKLSKVNGVSSVVVNLANKEAELTMKHQVSIDELTTVLPEKFSISIKTNEDIGAVFGLKEKSKFQQLKPLLLIFLYLFSGVFLMHFKDRNTSEAMLDFMGLFYIVFSFFKLLDLKGFPKSFAMYDPLAKVLPVYAWIYPFIELGLGLMFLMRFKVSVALVVTVIVLGVTTIGVVQSLLSKKTIRCACLGTALKLPMTEATFIENAIMLIMAFWMLLGK